MKRIANYLIILPIKLILILPGFTLLLLALLAGEDGYKLDKIAEKFIQFRLQ